MRYTISVAALILAVTTGAFAQKVGIINIQGAIGATKDGQKAIADMNAKFKPTQDRLQKKQADIEADKARLSQGSNAMSPEQKEKLMRDIDQKTKSLNRDAEDANAEADAETGKIMQELGGRIMAVLTKYAKEKGYSLILDVSTQQSPVLYAPDDVTEEIIKLYDANAPAPASAAPATSAPARPPASTPARPPATPPATKK